MLAPDDIVIDGEEAEIKEERERRRKRMKTENIQVAFDSFTVCCAEWGCLGTWQSRQILTRRRTLAHTEIHVCAEPLNSACFENG